MQLNSLSSNVQLGNVGQTTAFTMEANQFSFRVLSDGLYQNKIGSMVRETACNALDSHVQAGKGDVPITIHLPCEDEPYYSVSDNGIGLDDVGVRATFATYFRSTKRNDNSAVGAFGLGSKTPFAYTDAFTVTAVKDGRKRQYAAFINDEGLPSISSMGGTEENLYVTDDGEYIRDVWDVTDEPNGVTITVPVTSSSDYARFRNEVKNQLMFFPVKPVLLNNHWEITWGELVVSSYMDLGNVFVGKYSYGNPFNGLWLVQGPVGYKLDKQILEQSLSPDCKEMVGLLGECGILKFELGEIEVTPSREGIQYSKRTIAAIEKLLDSARAALKENVKERVLALGDAWNTAVTINGDEVLRRMMKAAKVSFTADGYYGSGGFYHLDLEKIADLDGGAGGFTAPAQVDLGFDATWESGDEEEDEDEDENETPQVSLRLQFRVYTKERTRRGASKPWKDTGVGRHAKPDASMVVLVRDTTDKAVTRIRAFMDSLYGNDRQVFVLQNRDGSVVTSDELDAIKARIGASWEPSLLSEVEPPARVNSRSNIGYKLPSAYLFQPSADFHNTSEWTRLTDKIGELEGAYYVRVHRGKVIDSVGIDRMIFELANAGLLDKPIVGIREKDVEKVAGLSEWVPIREKAKEILDSVTSNKTLINAAALESVHISGSDFFDDEVANVLKEAYEAGEFPETTVIGKFFAIDKSLARLRERYARAGYNALTNRIFAYSNVRVYDISNTFSEKLSEQYNERANLINETYPLLRFLSTTCRRRHNGKWESLRDHKESVLNYVKMMTGE